jgi:hypothetical protein
MDAGHARLLAQSEACHVAHTWRQQAFSAVDISAEVPLDLHAQRER